MYFKSIITNLYLCHSLDILAKILRNHDNTDFLTRSAKLLDENVCWRF